MARSVLWLRRDLRVSDSEAGWAAGLLGSDGVVVLFVLDPALIAPSGANRRAFLAECLADLDEQLDGRLCVRVGPPERVVAEVAAEVGTHDVVVTEDHGPAGRQRDARVARALARDGRRLVPVGSNYAVAPGTVRGPSGPYRVYTPFRRAWAALGWPDPLPTSPVARVGLDGLSHDEVRRELAGVPSGLPEWFDGLPLTEAPARPRGGGAAAATHLAAFVDGPLATYDRDRDRPGLEATSRLSAHLRFGTLHPRTFLAALPTGPGPDKARDELAWREFYADVLFHGPSSARHPWLDVGRHLETEGAERGRELFRRWALGQTGYELVDAGMRQLLHEGWMHNRVRMVTASFLVKDLHLDWRMGARWFMAQLVDGDLASNQHGWQWVAGVGTDAAPFHRVLNPDLQRERFDPDGAYVARYLTQAPDALIERAGPASTQRIVEHRAEREVALSLFAAARQAAAQRASRSSSAPERSGKTKS